MTEGNGATEKVGLAKGTEQVRYAVGLMSGTSVDGIDAAVVELAGEPAGGTPRARLLAFANTPFPPRVREEIFAMFEPSQATVDRVGRLNVWLGELYAQAALDAIAAAGLEASQISAIGSHGQTIYHSPQTNPIDGYDLRYTVQIGEGAVIAARTGIPCVSDFRPADMAVGGQGAPLVPFTEYLLYREKERTRLLQNIGGIGNVTVLPAGCAPEDVYAFDTGPGNVLIDGTVARLYPGLRMDAGGAIAGSGSVDASLLERLQRDDYYRKPPPKSTGREKFDAAYVEGIVQEASRRGLAPEDAVATVTLLTAWSIGEAYRRYIRDRHPAEELLVGGGGSYNETLLRFLKREMEPLGVTVRTQEEIGFSSDAKEAVAFALLADYTMARRPNNLPSATGAKRPVVLGKISF
ncbi:anhydro-N-acetylmuramic acid kinase [Cohnella zeiphila]|uniref:Anhydro-N-acetylmuramic acid kinase n=1 Tax=Cohnella zeiphila TaxID=2761120 RepID=A0A7X0VVZ8_9BACL|nr:anhydro-N-acetylmuramic acid kinase [Cohnella zeiphila]MBB6730433.1 anhydro-N-acetylmuramic acid kinase [Cohnella zeiphila]